MPNRLKKGFTLIEALVVGLLLALLAGGFLSIFSMTTRSGHEGSLQSTAQVKQETVYAMIGKRVRTGAHVLSGQHSEIPANLATYKTALTTRTIHIYDVGNVYKGGFGINASNQLTQLDTLNPAAPSTLITIGSRPLQLNATSTFRVHANRKTLGISLQIIDSANGYSVKRNFSLDTLRCRN